MNLFQKQNIELHSGQQSDFKIECDALTDEDWECLAYLISKQTTFDSVRGVPNGGNKLAKALEKYSTNTWQRIVLIVDDVLTTGKSMEEMKAKLIEGNPKHYEEVWFRGFVVFARSECPDWIKSLFSFCREEKNKNEI